jgi:UDP-N-acetylmuramyl pentapeptide phosphotransferase/UDP-N-acetylglucosamine-1-phosphate transferase
MSLVTLGLFLILSGDPISALTAFALAGGMLGFLYFNFNPARIFMGDTGSLVLGFVVSVLCIRLLQANITAASPVLAHAPVFILGIVLIPVADTIRVFSVRIWKGKSPFAADKTHIHHLLTNSGLSHAFTARVICCVHAFILIEVYWLRALKQEYTLLVLILIMAAVIILFRNSHLFANRLHKLKAGPIAINKK